ncbi:MAG: NAD(P)/FAD-dependent oxidoreductase, partial [Polyangiaceae bacterium]|nr:NAD(P)/FAD-dependent oxidoreductase [Polyangiaceae bacterium]
HPLAAGASAALFPSLSATCDALGVDSANYAREVSPLLAAIAPLLDDVLAPWSRWRHPQLMAQFGLKAAQSGARFLRTRFSGVAARALFAGCAAHGCAPLDRAGTAAFALILMLCGHHVGWPFPQGGAQQLSDALGRELLHHAGEIRTGVRVTTLRQVPPARAVAFDVSPRQLLAIAGDELPAGYRRRLHEFRHGPGVFKMDWALDGLIPWSAATCRDAGTVHVGGSWEEIRAALAVVASGGLPGSPFVIVSQPSRFDPSRTCGRPREIAWGYTHVPRGCLVDMTERVERQIERFAPGFRDRVVARHTMSPAQLEGYNANYVGGDISGGANGLWSMLARPVARYDPYATPNPRLFLCSSSTPPGGGVHGMAGYWAAQSILRKRFS